MTCAHVLVLTGAVLPGFVPESVWPPLAAYLQMEPEKLTQLLARAPLVIKQGDDPGALQTLQAGIAQTGAQTELCAQDDRPALFVLLDNTPRGPLPRVLAEQRVQQGLWTDSILVAEVGSTVWRPYRELDTPVVKPLPAPLPPSPAMEAGVLPAGAAIHAGFWRRCAAYTLDNLVLVPLLIISILPFVGWIIASLGRWLYFALMESSSWQATLGKRVMGIKVVDDHGRRIEFGRATGRHFGAILSCIIFDIGYMMAGWNGRKQALHDMVAGTCVVFDAVQPGQPLPTQRPPMPWYGWLLNVLRFLSDIGVIGVLVAIAVPFYHEYAITTKVEAAIASTGTIKAEIASRGCQAGSRPSPHPWIESINVEEDASGSCTVTLMLGQSADIPTGLHSKEIDLTHDEAGHWTCSSDMPNKYLPKSCR
ncbi:MAG: RDD family protein [Rhodanobacter sp.]|nr:RDD family protein [Rhodanobacter sp.]